MTADIKKIEKLGVLKKRAEFLHVRAGAYRAQGGIVIQMRANPNHQTIRVGFTATKKIGNAVIRNRSKRRLRELARALLPQYGLIGHDYVFIARNGTSEREWTALLDDTQKALITLCKRNGAKASVKT
jgi:ribonuclease P protein component